MMSKALKVRSMKKQDHRLGENYKKNHPHYNEKSKINRSQFAQQKKKYWENEWDTGRWK